MAELLGLRDRTPLQKIVLLGDSDHKVRNSLLGKFHARRYTSPAARPSNHSDGIERLVRDHSHALSGWKRLNKLASRRLRADSDHNNIGPRSI